MAKFDVELDYKGIKAVRSVKTRVSVQTAKLFKSHPASHVKPKLILIPRRYFMMRLDVYLIIIKPT